MRVFYGSINPYKIEHGRAKHIYHRLAERPDVGITWIDPPEPIIRRNLRYRDTFFRNMVRPVKVLAGNIDVYTPVGLPFYLSSKLAWSITEKALERFLDKLNLKPDLMIAASPIFLFYARKCREQGIPLIYDCRDYFAKWEHVGDYARTKEQELIRLSDLTIVPSFALEDEITRHHGEMNIAVIPNGVPGDMVGDCRAQADKKRPQIGYVGFLGNHVDYKLLVEIAKDRPNWDFVFAGNYAHIRRFVSEAPENCKFLGEVPWDGLDAVVGDLDVCTIPFIINDLTDVVFPIKLVEYFGKGKPVVSSPIGELKRTCGDLVYFAETKDEWISCLEAALGDERREEYINFARKYTWEDLAERYYIEMSWVMEK